MKDWERLGRSGRYDLNRLKTVMLLLIANDGMLPPEYADHPLIGQSARECHVGGDFLLQYSVDGAVLTFERTGSHNDLFNS